MDLANWALRTSPKFTTWVKYQFDQGFRPDKRSGSPNHSLPSKEDNTPKNNKLQKVHVTALLMHGWAKNEGGGGEIFKKSKTGK